MPGRKARAQVAQETVEILEAGSYTSPSGQLVELQPALQQAIDGTRLYAPQQFPEVFAQRDARLATFPANGGIHFEVINTTSLAACKMLVDRGCRDVVCLNFASAKNPGGGFLKGSQAQEESLARASGLYACINPRQTMYETNRRYRSSLYTDHMIYSPRVPVFRDDEDRLLQTPWNVSFLTVPAANAGAIADNEPENVTRIQETMLRRMEKLLSIAVVHHHKTLVLGAWGCGVFRNDPALVAQWFHFHLVENETFRNAFERVVFAVLDRDETPTTFQCFQNRFA